MEKASGIRVKNTPWPVTLVTLTRRQGHLGRPQPESCLTLTSKSLQRKPGPFDPRQHTWGPLFGRLPRQVQGSKVAMALDFSAWDQTIGRPA